MQEDTTRRAARHYGAHVRIEAESGPRARSSRLVLRPHRVFLLLWLIAATIVAIFTPLGAGFDETMHIARVAQLSQGVVLPSEVEYDKIDDAAAVKPETDEYALYGGTEDAALQEFAKRGNVSFQTDVAYEPYSFPWWTDARFDVGRTMGEGEVTWAFPNTSINSPVVYLPYVLGYLASTLVTGNVIIVGIVTRLCGVAFFGLAVAAAIRIAPFGKWLMAAVALSPLSLLDNSFVTADMMTIAAVAVFLSAVLRLVCEDPGRRLDWVLVGASGCVIAVAKLAYLPFGLLLFLVPLVRADARNRATWTRVALICALALALFGIWYLQIKDINTGALWSDSVDPAEQTRFVLSNPLRYLFLYVKRLFATDCLALTAPFLIMYPSWFSVLVLLVAANSDRPSISRAWGHLGARRGAVPVFLLLVWVLVGFLIVLALYLQFTSVGSPEIDGVQSRYFLPLIVPLLLAVALPLLSHDGERESDRDGAGCLAVREVAPTVALLSMTVLTLLGLFILMH